MVKRLNRPSALGALSSKAFQEAAENAVARARLAGVKPAGAEAPKPTPSARSRTTARRKQVEKAD